VHNDSFNRSHFLNVTLREVERDMWTPRFTGIQRVSGSSGFAGPQSAMGATYRHGGIAHALPNGNRVARVRQALDDSRQAALQLLEQKYHALQIDAIAPHLVSACLDLGLLLGSRQVTNSGRALLSHGNTSDMPRLLSAFWELMSIAPMLGPGVQTKLSDYEEAFNRAWGPRQPPASNSHRLMELSATRNFAQGHVIAITALLTGIVAYAKRGPAAPSDMLMQLKPEISKSPRLGNAVMQWLEQNQAAILSHPLLNQRAIGVSSTDETLASVPLPARGAPAAAPDTPAPAAVNPLENVDQDIQAATLVRAASSGTPFCAVCEKAAAANDTKAAA
jgi:hypothetical protein